MITGNLSSVILKNNTNINDIMGNIFKLISNRFGAIHCSLRNFFGNSENNEACFSMKSSPQKAEKLKFSMPPKIIDSQNVNRSKLPAVTFHLSLNTQFISFMLSN